MLQATIDNHSIESFLFKKFNGDKEKISAYINDFLANYLPYDAAFQEDRKRFHETHRQIKDGVAILHTEEDADQAIETFLKTL